MSMIGKALGNFQITAQLGIGGMGEVYQAKDQKLGRDVAIKVLPEEFARDTDRVTRFQREAKLLASLNHPNIAAIYGLEESDGTHYLVLELIEGDTLADRIRTGPIPVEESLKFALQIAEALEAAHEKGVIHRDLKPANIKITPDGKVKVLDFGLAKAYAGDSDDVNLSNSPTLSAAATQQGVILGTAAYMSPEQARGETVDKRADIWAFGVVLFEMLTGRTVFEGRSVSDILASVLKIEPEWKSLPPNLHSRIRFLLERCLKKEPKNRYSGISDARVEIQEVLADPSGLFVQPGIAAKPRKKLRLGLPWVAAAVAFSIIVGGLAVWYFRPAEPLQVMRFDYELPPNRQFSNLTYLALAISPDGKQFAYSTNEGLFLRSVEEFAAKLIAGTEGPTSSPFFSPDGKWIGYFSVQDFALKKININGGAPVTLCDTTPYGVDWGTDGTIIYGQAPGIIMQVSANGGNAEPLVNSKVAACVYPQMLPDGQTVIYTSPLPRSTIMVQSLESGEAKELFAGVAAKYVPTGHIVYGLSDSNTLFAVPFNLDTLEVTGDIVPIVENIISPLHYAVSDSGTLTYIPGTTISGSFTKRNLVWVDRKGNEEPLSAEPNDYRTPRISPDGAKVAWTVAAGEKSDIWTWDIYRETQTRLTFDGLSAYPLWTPDGKRIAFLSGDVTSELAASIRWKAADGTGEEEEVGSVPGQLLLPWSWSEDGKTLALFEADITAGINYNVGILSMEGDREWKSLLNEKHIEFQPQISPDGKWMAYTSDESGQVEIYARPFPDWDKGKWQVSTGGGSTPLWAPNGRELFYRGSDGVMAVSIETEPGFKAGKPVTLFRDNYVPLTTNDGQPWDIHPDGKRFLMIKTAAASDDESVAATPQKINIVLNFFEELKRRAPAD